MYTKNFKYIQSSYTKNEVNQAALSSNRLGPKKENLNSVESKKNSKRDHDKFQKLDEGYIGNQRTPLEEQAYSQSKNTKNKINNIARYDYEVAKEK